MRQAKNYPFPFSIIICPIICPIPTTCHTAALTTAPAQTSSFRSAISPILNHWESPDNQRHADRGTQIGKRESTASRAGHAAAPRFNLLGEVEDKHLLVACTHQVTSRVVEVALILSKLVEPAKLEGRREI